MDFKTTIREIFEPERNQFAVPSYQRAYSWERDKHVTQFLDDLDEHPESVKQYHLGHFLFENDSLNTDKFWVIDGQQRLTTVVIFLSCVYKHLSDATSIESDAKKLYNSYIVSLVGVQKFFTVDYDNNFFANVVLDGREDDSDTKSKVRIKEAFDFFSDRISKSKTEIVLRWKELIENAKITTDIVTDKAEATQIFTFQNDRGKDLTNLEKLKAFLMLQVYLNSNRIDYNTNDFIRILDREFESIYESLEKITIADEDQILNYHTTAFLSVSDNAIVSIKTVLSKKSKEEQSRWIKDFVVQLKRSFEMVIAIEGKVNTYSHVADVLFLDQANSFPLLLKLFHYNRNDVNLEAIIRLIEIILFRLKYTTGSYYTNYLPHIACGYDGKNINDLKEKLHYHAKNGFKHYWNFELDFYKCLEGNYHYWPITRYLLWKHENSLRSELREPSILFFEFKNLFGSPRLENTIDHWTPQNPYEIEYEQEFKENYLNNIGNLVLSTRGRNASDSNSLPIHRSTFSVLISRQKLEDHKGDWKKEQIKERQSEIVSFAKKYWNPENIK